MLDAPHDLSDALVAHAMLLGCLPQAEQTGIGSNHGPQTGRDGRATLAGERLGAGGGAGPHRERAGDTRVGCFVLATPIPVASAR